jgi:tetratricopeptide (TPR) repeat protein
MSMTRRGKKRLTLLLALVIIGSGGVGLWQLRNIMRNSSAQSGFTTGRAHYEAGEYTQAFSGLNAYVRVFPENAEAWYMLADSRRRVPQENNRHLFSAAAFGTNAVEADPTSIQSYELLLDVYTQLGQYLEASVAADALLKQSPANTEALWVLVQSHLVMGNHEKALEYAHQLIKQDPDDMRPRLAVLELIGLLGSGIEEILDQSAAFVRSDPDNLKLMLLHIDLLYRYGKADEALELLDRAREAGVEDSSTLALFVAMLDRNGMRDEAEQIILEAQSNPDIADASRGMQLERLWKQGRQNEAQELLRDISFDPVLADDSLLGWAAIVQFGDTGESDTTISAQLATRSTDTSRFWSNALRAYALMQDQQWTQAYEVLRTLEPFVLESDRDVLEFWNGVTLMALGEVSRASSSFRDVARLDPTWDQPVINLVQSLLLMDRLEEAFSLVQSRLQLADHPMKDLVSAQVITKMIEAGLPNAVDSQQVVDLMQSSVDPDSPNGTIQALIARAQIALGQTAQATQTITDIIENKKELLPSELVALHTAMQTAGLDTSALSQLSAAQHPNNPDAIFLLAMEAVDVERIDEAKSIFHDALVLDKSLGMRRAFAAFLDAIHDPEAAERLRELSDDFTDSAKAQLDVLESGAAWLDEQLVIDGINRLHELTGDEGEVWRIYEARRQLVFHRNEEHASSASLILRDLIRVNPLNTPALILMADAMFVLDNESEGIGYLERVLLSQPNNPEHYQPLIERLQKLGRMDEAERWLRDYLQLHDLTLTQRRLRTTMLLTQGLWGAALPELQALASTGEPNDLIRLAQAFIRRGDAQQAQRVFEQVLASPQSSLAHWSAAAIFYATQGEFEDGLAILRDAPSATQTEADVLRGEFYEQMGMDEEAGLAYRSAALNDPTGDAWKEVISFLIRSVDMAAARETLTEALSLHSDNPGLLAFEELLEERSSSLTTSQITQIAESLGSNVNPQAVQMLISAAELYRTSDGSAQSLVALQEVVEKFPWFYTAWHTWISALVTKNDEASLQQAVEAARRSLNSIPNEPRVASLAYDVFVQAGLFSEAANAAQEWKIRSPAAGILADVALAGALQQQGAFATALDTLEPWAAQLIEEADEQPDRFALYVSLLVQNGNTSDAEALLAPLIEGDLRWTRTMLQLARVLPADQAVRQRWFELLRPLSKLPNDLLQLTLYAHESGTLLGAWWYERVLELTPSLLQNPNARLDAIRFNAAATEQLGRLDEAEAYYKQALELQPDDAVSLNNLAYLVFTAGDDLEAAAGYARRAVEVEMPLPLHINFRDTLGEILQAQQKQVEAKTVYQAGLALDPTAVQMHLGLAEIALQASDVAEATQHLNAIRDAGGIPAGSPFADRFQAAWDAAGHPY